MTSLQLQNICTLIFVNFFPNPCQTYPVHIQSIQQVKQHVKSLPCLGIPHPDAFMLVETDASDIGYGGILKQRLGSQNEQLVSCLLYTSDAADE